MKYPDRASLRLDLTQFLQNGILPVVGEHFPPLLEDFGFVLRLPDERKLSLRGQIISLRDQTAMIQIADWSEQLFGAVERASEEPAKDEESSAPVAVFSEGQVRYSEISTLKSDLEPFLRHGIIRASGRGFPPLLEDFQFQLVLPTGRILLERGQIVSLRQDEALIQVPGWTQAAWSSIESATRPEPPTSPPPVAPQPEAISAPLQPMDGTLRNPIEPSEWASLPVKTGAIVKDIAQPSLISLVRWLGTHQATGTLTVKGPSRVEIRFRRGRVVLEKKQEPALVAATWASASYRFEPGIDTQIHPKGCTAWSFAILLLKRAILDAKVEVLKSELPTGRSPALTVHGADFLSALNLTATELRFGERYLDGKTSIQDLYRTSWLSEVSLTRLLYLLHLLEFVEWRVAPKQSAAAPKDRLHSLYEERVKGDLFGALGVHFTDSPARIEAAYREMVDHYGPQSPEPRAPYAEKLLALANEAWQVLGDRASRQKYRREVLRVDGEIPAQLLAEKAKWCLIRGEKTQAQELLEAAFDLHPTREYREALQRTRKGDQELQIEESEDGVGDSHSPGHFPSSDP